MIKYIGSKRTLVPRITELVAALPAVGSACDVFTGTTRVAQALKRMGIRVTANDSTTYSATIAKAYIEADADALDIAGIRDKLAELNALPGVRGYVTETFCERSRYLQPHNGMRVDAIRPAIDEVAADGLERAVLLTSLLEAADRVDSTTGLQMAYLKQWSPRSYNDLELRLPELLPGVGRATQRDANELAHDMAEVDLCYVDPPYNQHSYLSNYHVWETIARGDEPEVYGVACKRVDCRTTKSPYNSKRLARDAFADLVRALPARHLIVSFNNEGYLDADDIVALLGERGEVAVLPVDFKRYVGAQIGIHDLSGKRVGEVSHLRNTEYLFVVGDGAANAVDRVAAAAPSELTRS